MNDFIKPLSLVRQKGPLVQCITNFVTVNDCANVILAAGGSPSMSQDVREVEESVAGVSALVCNLGAIDRVDSMILAGRTAVRLRKPVIFDPVAAGRTRLRRDEAGRFLSQVPCTVIRGNASEIRFLAGQQRGQRGAAAPVPGGDAGRPEGGGAEQPEGSRMNRLSGSGVDVSAADAVSREKLPAAIQMAKTLALDTGSVIAVSGELDIITDGRQTAVLSNGCSTMARITGSGCMLTALMGAFCGAVSENAREDIFAAAVSAAAVMGVCGELAEKRRLEKGTGNATFRTDLIDAVFNLTEAQLMEGIRYEIY